MVMENHKKAYTDGSFMVDAMEKIFHEFLIDVSQVNPNLFGKVREFLMLDKDNEKKYILAQELYDIFEEFFKMRRAWIVVNLGEEFFDFY